MPPMLTTSGIFLFQIDVRIEEYEGLKDHVSKTGETINGALRRAIREMIEQDTQAP